MTHKAKSVPTSGDSSSTLVRRNALWNIGGQAAPLLLALFFIPPLIREMGTDRFGALTLVWTFLAYFTLFDLGLGRALTQLLARGSGDDKKEEAGLVWTTSVLSAGLGLLGALILCLLAPLFVNTLLRIQGALADEMVFALRELALALPILIHGQALKGILEAKRRFDLSNWVKILLGIFTYSAPLLVVQFSSDLRIIVGILLVGRLLGWLANLFLVFHIMPELKSPANWKLQRFRDLLGFGGWLTISYIVTPFTDNTDRFLITNLLSISMVAYFTTPLELMNKLSIISLGIGGVVFPEFAARFHRDSKEAESLYFRGTKYILAVLFPLVLLATAYAHEGLAIWLNPKFAATSGTVIQWLAIALLLGGFRLIPYFFLIGIGRPVIPALYDLFELPLYAGVMYMFIKLDGIRGAAIAYALRVTVGGLFYHFISGRILGFRWPSYLKVIWLLGVATLILLGFHIPMSQLLKGLLVFGVLAMHGCLVWFFVLEQKDKHFILKRLAGRP